MSQSDLDDLPNIDSSSFKHIDETELFSPTVSHHKPRILLLHGSLRPRSFSRLLTMEAKRLLDEMGAETQIFDPTGCHYLMMLRLSTLKFRSLGNSPNGQKVKYGVLLNVTAQ